MTGGNALLLGQIAIDWEFITREALRECLEDQSRQDSLQPLGSLLVSKGLMDDAQLVRILEEQRTRFDRACTFSEMGGADLLFGRLLVRNGLVSELRMNEALRAQQDLADRGRTRRLGEILVECGAVSAELVRETLASQGKSIMRCSFCELRFNVVEQEQTTFHCEGCRGRLQPETEVLDVEETVGIPCVKPIPPLPADPR